MTARRGAAAVVRRGLLCALATGVVSGFGCSSSGPETLVSNTVIEHPPPVGPRAGIETRLWWLRDDDARIALALQAAPSPLDDAFREQFARAGYRLVGVHQDDLDDLENTLAPAGARDRTWRGMMPSWRELVPGVDRDEAWVRIGDESAPLTAGRVRTLGRAFPVPPERPGQSPAMWLELITAHVPESGRLLVLPATRVGWRAEPGMAYLLVPEAIEIDWSEVALAAEAMTDSGLDERVPGPMPDAPSDDVTEAQDPQPSGGRIDVTSEDQSMLGPVSMPDPLLGLWSMTRVLPPLRGDAPPRPMRQVLVIVPRASP